GATDIIRVFIVALEFLQEPFWVYAVATRFRWEVEAEFASNRMRGLSLRDEKNQESLQRISTILLVFKFHRKERDDLRKGMEWDAGGGRCGRLTGLVSMNGADVEGVLANGRNTIESWTMFVGDGRVAGDRCLLDGEVSRCGKLAYDRLEVLERARKCLIELLERVGSQAFSLGVLK
ncbi:hypothetical protein ARMGADRAFT_1132919, partial [Armillaria gallica]